MMYRILFLLLLLSPLSSLAQDKAFVEKIFNNTRIINAHTPEINKKRELDFQIKHRFGDVGGLYGGKHLLYGLDGIADYRLALEYTITNAVQLGVGRSKGVATESGARELFDFFVKARLMRQTQDDTQPFAITFVGNSVYSAMKPEAHSLQLTDFTKESHRFSYFSQFIVARKFSDRLSLQLMPSVVYRNIVPYYDSSMLFALGLGGKIGITKVTSLLFDYYQPFSKNIKNNKEFSYSAPLSLGLEFNTGKHIFDINFTNAKAILENQFIPYTASSWSKGEFRLGFTISRIFTM